MIPNPYICHYFKWTGVHKVLILVQIKKSWLLGGVVYISLSLFGEGLTSFLRLLVIGSRIWYMNVFILNVCPIQFHWMPQPSHTFNCATYQLRSFIERNLDCAAFSRRAFSHCCSVSDDRRAPAAAEEVQEMFELYQNSLWNGLMNNSKVNNYTNISPHDFIGWKYYWKWLFSMTSPSGQQIMGNEFVEIK